MSARASKKTSGPAGWTPPDLRGRVAVVAAASRGAGRGIALALGDCGATVYATSRTTRGGPKPPDGAPGCVEDTAEEVTKRGGKGIPVRGDYMVESDVAALFERVEREQGRLDIAVNAAFGGDRFIDFLHGKWRTAPFWETECAAWRELMMAGPSAGLLLGWHAARMMAPRRRGLIVSISELDQEGFGGGGLWETLRGLGHRGINKTAEAMSRNLKKRNVAIVAVLPGFMRTERVVASMEQADEKTRKMFRFDKSESTEYVGRAVAHLAGVEGALAKTGKLLFVGDLAKEYGFTDVDGKAPNFYREVFGIK